MSSRKGFGILFVIVSTFLFMLLYGSFVYLQESKDSLCEGVDHKESVNYFDQENNIQNDISLYSCGVSVLQAHFPKGTYTSKDNINTRVFIRNHIDLERSFTVEYSVVNPEGETVILDRKKVDFSSLGTKEVALSSSVSDIAPFVSGKYHAAITVKTNEQQPIVHVEGNNAFSLYNHVETFHDLDEDIWSVRDEFLLGKGYLLEENVSHVDGQMVINVNPDTYSGGEIRTRKKMQYGTFETKLKVADVPGSITGFFLYTSPDLYHEIDVEIFNDSNGTVMFTVYKDGEKARHDEKELGFDPTKEFNTYRFEVMESYVSFYVNDKEFKRWEGSFSTAPMKLMVNSWFPKWVSPSNLDQEDQTIIDQINY